MNNIMEILDMLQFFGGQRSGRELWADKPTDVQDADIESFNKNINAIRDYIQQLEAERDAAVETIYEMSKCITEDVCEWCDGVECERLCVQHTILRPGFKWRGVKEEKNDDGDSPD